MPIYAFTGSLTRPMPQYGAANGKGIGRLVFDDETGRLSLADLTGNIDDTAWLVPDPRRNRLYSTCEITGTNQSAVVAYEVGPTGRGMQRVGEQQTLGNEACHASLSNDGRFLLVANYNGANPEGYPDAALTVFPIGSDGALEAPVASVRHTGSGPNPDRQTTAHAHCVVQSPTGDTVYLSDLGIDKLVAYRLDNAGGLTRQPTRDFTFPPGLGPRHLVFHPDGRSLFVVSELIATVLSLAVDPATGALTEHDAFRIEREVVQSAGILLAPDGRHLFVSLRVCDEILVLRIEPDGRLTQTARVPSGGKTPRDLAFSPSGRHLVVANQDSDRLTVFGVDHAAGTLSEPLQHFEIGTPMSVKLAAY